MPAKSAASTASASSPDSLAAPPLPSPCSSVSKASSRNTRATWCERRWSSRRLGVQAAARALMETTELDARAIVERALSVAADICVYTNHHLTIEELDAAE